MRHLKTALSAALFGFGGFSLDAFDLDGGVSVSAQTVRAVNLVKVWAYARASGAANRVLWYREVVFRPGANGRPSTGSG